VSFRDLTGLAAVTLAASLVAAGGTFSDPEAGVAGLLLALLAAALWAPGFPLFLAWSAVSAILASPGYLASKETLGTWAAALVLFALVRRMTPGSKTQVLTILTVTALLTGLGILCVCVVQGFPFSGGVFRNANMGAAVLAALIPLVASAPSRLLRFTGTPLLVLAIGLTGSRAGLAALAAVTLILLPGRIRWAGGMLAGAAGAFVVWWRLSAHPDSLAWFRWSIWEALLRLWAQHPLTGVSPGGLYDMSGTVRLATPIGCSLHARHMAGAESTLLGILVTTGLVGALLAIAVAAAALAQLRSSQDTSQRNVALAVLAGSLALALFHDFLQEPGILWWWAVIAGFLLPRGSHREAHAVPGAMLSLRTAVAAGVMAWMILQPVLGRLAVSSSPSPEANALRMLRLEPWDDGPARKLASGLLSSKGRWSWETAGEASFWGQQVVKVHPGSASSQALSGRINSRIVSELGAYPSAIAAAREGFQKACRLEPHLPWYWSEWATLERQLGELKRARRLASRAVTEEPNYVRGWLLLGRIDLDLGQLTLARSDLERAREARMCFKGRILEAFEQDLLWAPPWQWRQLEEALP